MGLGCITIKVLVVYCAVLKERKVFLGAWSIA